MNQNQFGKLIKAAREKRGLTQAALADKIGCSDAYITLLEKGKRTPSLEFVKLLNKHLGTPTICPICGTQLKR